VLACAVGRLFGVSPWRSTSAMMKQPGCPALSSIIIFPLRPAGSEVERPVAWSHAVRVGLISPPLATDGRPSSKERITSPLQAPSQSIQGLCMCLADDLTIPAPATPCPLDGHQRGGGVSFGGKPRGLASKAIYPAVDLSGFHQHDASAGRFRRR